MNTTFQNAAGIDADVADVGRVLAGDVNGFEGIVRRWQGPLVNMAWRYCRDRGRAEELAQEALVRAWRGLAVTLPIDEVAEPSKPARQHIQIEERSREVDRPLSKSK